MAVTCTPQAIVSGAGCLDQQLPVGIRPAVISYLLAILAGGSTNAKTILAAATGAGWFDIRLSRSEYDGIQLYLLCNKINATTTCDVKTAVAASTCFKDLPVSQLQAGEVLVLATAGSVSTSAKDLIALAVSNGFTEASKDQLAALDSYLTAQIVGNSGSIQDIFTASVCWQCLDSKLRSGLLSFLWCSARSSPPPAFNGLLNALAAYYKMDDVGGGLLDSSINGNSASAGIGEIYLQPGVIGDSIDFNQNDAPCVSPLRLGFEGLSFNLWIKEYADNYDPYIAFGLDSNGAGFYIRDYSVNFTTGANDYFLMGYPTGFYNTLRDKSWHMFTVILPPSGDIKLYIDGVLLSEANGDYVVTGAVLPGIVQVDGGIGIGNRTDSPGPGGSVGGYMDEMGIWARSLTQSDVTALFNAGAGLPYSSFTL